MDVRTHTDAELAALGVDGLWAHLADLQRFSNRLDAYRARVVAVAEQTGAADRAGRRRMADALVTRAGISRSDARRVVRAAHTTLEHPEVGELFGRGEITQTQAVAVAEAKVPEEVRRRLLAAAPTLTSDQTTELVAQAERAQVDPDQVFMRQRELRSASRYCDGDGMWNLQVRLDPEAGSRADAVLDAHLECLWRADKHAGRTHQRTPLQRLADAFTVILDTAGGESDGERNGERDGASWRGPRVTLNITVPHTWLTEQAHTAGVAANGATLSAETLRRLACDAEILPTVLGGPGEVLDVGRARRTATDPQRRALEARDGGCFNCGTPPSRCHAHHIEHWAAHHGRTDLGDLVLVCRDCHILLHEGGHTLTRTPDGRWALAPPAPDRPQSDRPPDQGPGP